MRLKLLWAALMRRGNLKSVIILLFSVFLLSLPTAYCASTDNNLSRLFVEANTKYEECDYDKSAALYNKILSDKFESGAVYYNLGNCYFKKGDIGRAILFYERAARLIPMDRDLKANYKYALSEAGISGLSIKKNWFLMVRDNVFGYFTINGITVLMFSLYVLIAVIVFLGIALSLPKRYWITVTVVFSLILIIGFSSFMEKKSLLNNEAVVLKDMAEARFEPSQNATKHFSLPEGLKVRIIDSRNCWVKIKRYDGKIGWVESVSIEVI